jgi:hypothetical protein
MKAIHFNGKVLAYGEDNGTYKVFATENTDGNSWKQLSLPETSYLSMTSDGNLLYALSADAKLYGSIDTEQWTEISQNTQLKTLVAASRTEIYAMSTEGKIMKSSDQGATWTEDNLDSDAGMLPEKDFNGITTASLTNSDIDKVVLIGNRNDTNNPTSVVWSKVVDTTMPSKTQAWMYQEYSEGNRHQAPALESLCVTTYNKGLIMIGGDGLGTVRAQAFDRILFSYDNGQNWWSDDRFYLPQNMKSSKTSFALVSDSNNYLWLLCGETGQVWKGHLSQLTWQ